MVCFPVVLVKVVKCSAKDVRLLRSEVGKKGQWVFKVGYGVSEGLGTITPRHTYPSGLWNYDTPTHVPSHIGNFVYACFGVLLSSHGPDWGSTGRLPVRLTTGISNRAIELVSNRANKVLCCKTIKLISNRANTLISRYVKSEHLVHLLRCVLTFDLLVGLLVWSGGLRPCLEFGYSVDGFSIEDQGAA